MSMLKKIFSVLKFQSFIETYTNIGINSGIKHRKNNTGTSAASKTTSFTDDDKKAIKSGLEQLEKDIQEAKKEL